MTIYHRPSKLTRLSNRVMSWFASRGLLPLRMITLEVKGRSSGQVRSAVVNIVTVDGVKYLVSPRGEAEWVRNVRAAGGQAVIRHGKRKAVRLEEMPPGATAAIIKTYLEENAMATKGHFGIPPGSPIEEFARIAPRHPVFRITQTA